MIRKRPALANAGFADFSDESMRKIKKHDPEKAALAKAGVADFSDKIVLKIKQIIPSFGTLTTL